ncbi:DUF4436 domain-containing protein [Burkholderia pseudomallei]|nr:DUF4436 domain-containing protein [Burkholderia pseudomallei]
MKVNFGKIFSIFTLVAFIFSAAGYLLWAPTDVFDTHGRDKCRTSSSPEGSGQVYLHIEGGSGGKFRMKGSVYVPVWLWPKATPESLRGWTSLPAMSEDGNTHFAGLPVSISPPVETRLGSIAVYQMDIEERSVGIGSLRNYPFDQYWVGIKSAQLNLQTQSGQPVASVPLELSVRFDGESGWDARRDIGVDDATPARFDTFTSQSNQSSGMRSCGFTIKRSFWYIGFVFLLLAISATPVLYVWRRPQEPAGLELIAAILGMATLRSYLIGPPPSVGSLLPFDFILALVIIAVAFIPLWKRSTHGPK